MELETYIVTLYKHEDLEQFYDEMKSNNFHLVMKRPMSRNTHYKMTEEQAEELRKDPRVWDVQLPFEKRGIILQKTNINYSPYNVAPLGGFRKDGSSISPFDTNWGLKHHGDETVGLGQKGNWGSGSLENYSGVNVDIFNDGKHVDVVICDDPVSYDCDEWLSPTTGQTRFNQYDWYGQLNSLVSSIDDDGETVPSAPYSNYFQNSNNTEYHGTHVCGTVAGQYYGWAREANIYSMQVLSNSSGTGTKVPSLLIFDYLRAFHRNKTINPDTGIKNPTIVNNSWATLVDLTVLLDKSSLSLSDINYVIYRGNFYTSSNPNPSGWTWAGLEADFGFASNKMLLNSTNANLNADVEDAINEGIVMVAAAGNNNFHCVRDGDPDYNNSVGTPAGFVYYNRGCSPAASGRTIVVGALSNHVNLHRATYSNFGPLIDIFAAGDYILSAFNNVGLADSKYGGAPNYFYPIPGTSMASPQVAGVLACLATGKERFTQGFARKYLKNTSASGEMDFDTISGNFADNTCQQGSPNLTLIAKNPRTNLTGMISEQISNRTNNGGLNGLTFPRVSVFNRPAPKAQSKTLTLSVTNIGGSHYVFNGPDRVTSHVDAQDPTININQGDTLVLTFSISGTHPFWIKTQYSSGSNNPVTTGTITNNGQQTSNLTWDTNGVASGTYYYVCSIHWTFMRGEIIVT